MLLDPFGDVPKDLQGGVVAIGNFEGVHRGHCRLLARLRERARQLAGPAVAISFDPHPLRLLRPETNLSSLVWSERKEALLRQSGADGVAILQTTHRFLDLSPEEFFQEIVRNRFEARGMVEGRNFNYGKNRGGNIQFLAEECRRAKMTLDVVDIVTGEGESEISSSRIRRELLAGNIEKANDLLGRPHRIKGTVIAGDRRGSRIGFPTANLSDIPVLLPRNGVYAGQTVIDGRRYPAACNLGPNPTFGVAAQKFEAHLVGFEGDLYGRMIEIDLLSHLRDVRAFAGIEELVAQLARDVEEVRRTVENWHHPFGCDLGQTITEWLRSEVQPSLDSMTSLIEKAVLDASGTLTVYASISRENLPHVVLDLLLRLENRLRSVFSEVRRMRWDT